MKQHKYNVIYEDNTVRNIYAFSAKEARKIADRVLKSENIEDTFNRVESAFEGEFYSNRY
jgi:hypothetical protein